MVWNWGIRGEGMRERRSHLIGGSCFIVKIRSIEKRTRRMKL